MNNKILNSKPKFLLLLSVILVAGFVSTSLVSYFVSLNSLRKEIDTSSLPLTSDNIYSEIQRDLLQPIFITSLMANDTFLKDWILSGEKDVGLITKYLKEILIQYGTFSSFFVSENTYNYYQSDGILKKVSPSEDRDIWYFRVEDLAGDYELNVDPDMANDDAMTIFINHKVKDYEGNYLGATGVGLTINFVNQMINKYADKYDRNIYFVDQTGKVQLNNLNHRKRLSNIMQIPELQKNTDKLLSKQIFRMNYQHNNQTFHLNTRYIEELDWYLFVEQSEKKSISSLNKALWSNLLLCLFITIIVLFLTFLSLNIYQKLNKDQQDIIVKKKEELEEKNSKLKEAISLTEATLEKNNLLMHEMNHRVKNNLATIQSLLRFESRQTMDDQSRLVLKESESRVRSITNIHDMLAHNTDLSNIGVPIYINKLIKDLIFTFNIDESKIQISQQIENVKMDMDIMVPFALILNELITNAFKYAFPGEHFGTLLIELIKVSDSEVELIVEDNGNGLPEGYNIDQNDSLGSSIISLLTKQIKGELSYTTNAKGTKFVIRFPYLKRR